MFCSSLSPDPNVTLKYAEQKTLNALQARNRQGPLLISCSREKKKL